MPCLTGASNVFFSSVVELHFIYFFPHEKFTIFHTGKIHYPHSRTETGSRLRYQTAVCFIDCRNTAAGTATRPVPTLKE